MITVAMSAPTTTPSRDAMRMFMIWRRDAAGKAPPPAVRGRRQPSLLLGLLRRALLLAAEDAGQALLDRLQVHVLELVLHVLPPRQLVELLVEDLAALLDPLLGLLLGERL